MKNSKLSCVLCAVGVWLGLQGSAVAGSARPLTACVKQSNGQMRLVADPTDCLTSEYPISWNRAEDVSRLQGEIELLRAQVHAIEARLDAIEGRFTEPVIFVPSALSLAEGDSALLQLTLSKPSIYNVQVAYEIKDGTAVRPRDYEAPASGLVVFAPGQTEASIRISASENFVLKNPDIQFNIDFFQPVRATLNEASTVVTITDDGDLPTLLFALQNAPVEGDPIELAFWVYDSADTNVACDAIDQSRLYAAHDGVSVRFEPNYAGTEPTFTDAIWGEDVITDGTFYIPPSQSSPIFNLQTVDDTLPENPTEYFGVVPVEVVGANLADCLLGHASYARIYDND